MSCATTKSQRLCFHSNVPSCSIGLCTRVSLWARESYLFLFIPSGWVFSSIFPFSCASMMKPDKTTGHPVKSSEREGTEDQFIWKTEFDFSLYTKNLFRFFALVSSFLRFRPFEEKRNKAKQQKQQQTQTFTFYFCLCLLFFYIQNAHTRWIYNIYVHH